VIGGLWRRYQAFGLHPELSAQQARYVRALNGTIVIVTALLWLQLPLIVSLLPETRSILLSFMLWPLAWQLVPLLNHRRRYTVARVYYSLTSIALVTFNAVQLGPATDNHFFMLAVCIASFIIFPPDDVRWLAGILVVAASALAGLEWYYHTGHDALVSFPDHLIGFVRWSSMSALFFIMIGITVYSYRVVAETEAALTAEHRRSESLLLNILPASIAARLKLSRSPIADRIEGASVLFADLVGFTELADRVPHEDVVHTLDTLFSAFDRIAGRHGLEKIKTIGDAYMAAAGVPTAMADSHLSIADCALEMLEFVRSRPLLEAPELRVRIGIHCGPVIAGVICESKFAYDIWGDTVNVASRMESHGLPDRIQVSAAFFQRTSHAFDYAPRGSISIKGKGDVETFLLLGRKDSPTVMNASSELLSTAP